MGREGCLNKVKDNLTYVKRIRDEPYDAQDYYDDDVITSCVQVHVTIVTLKIKERVASNEVMVTTGGCENTYDVRFVVDWTLRV